MENKSTSLCFRCGNSLLLDPLIINGKEIIRSHLLCQDCAAARETEIAQAKQEEARLNRLSRWREVCPTSYRKSDVARLPEEPAKQVLTWKENQDGRGLLLIGPPRTHKTRSIWVLLQNLFLDEGTPFMALSDTEFAHECSFRFANQMSREWVQRLCMVRVLFLDDLGKAAPTERYRHELFHIIEQRTAWSRPLLVTTNFDGEELARRIGDTVGIAIVERLREFCQIVCFNRPDDFQPSNIKEKS